MSKRGDKEFLSDIKEAILRYKCFVWSGTQKLIK
jgi:hypothetical protein